MDQSTDTARKSSVVRMRDHEQSLEAQYLRWLARWGFHQSASWNVMVVSEFSKEAWLTSLFLNFRVHSNICYILARLELSGDSLEVKLTI